MMNAEVQHAKAEMRGRSCDTPAGGSRWASWTLIACLALALLAAGCGRVELYQDLTEEEANEILVLLAENGIRTNKKKTIVQNEVSYAVEVRDTDMVRARSLLLQHNLPRKREQGLDGVYKEKGLIPTPDEQKARFLLALKGEIINSLERIPQIVDADVVLNVPQRDEFANAEEQKLQRPTASVIVRVKPEASGLEGITEPKIQQFVSSAIEGMNPRDVTVIISYVSGEEPPMRPGDVKTLPAQGLGLAPAAPAAVLPPATAQELMGLKLDEDSKAKLRIYLLIFFLLLVVLSSALIVTIVQASRLRRTIAAVTRGPAGERPAVEGQVLDEGPPRLGGGS